MAHANRRMLVRLPRALLSYWSGPATVDVDASSLDEALGGVEERAPGLRARILDDQGRLRRHVAVFVNEERVEPRDPAMVPLSPGDHVLIMPAVSGG